MTMLSLAIGAAERVPVADSLTLTAIEFLCARTARQLAGRPAAAEDAFVASMTRYPIATHTEVANRQHYDVPPEFFGLVLGPQRKYSCCFYEAQHATLALAEETALAYTVDNAEIRDGQTILELGCGWGSLSLYLARRFPRSNITSVSNSATQRQYILEQVKKAGIGNLTVITADMNDFVAGQRYDRIVSVEMFEHMSNWRTLLERTRAWLQPNGKLFLHVFTHKDRSYRFDPADPTDWIAQHFFTGGIMPAADLPHRFADLFHVEKHWHWSGQHYQRTARDWLANFDSEIDRINPILRQVYGRNAALWQRRWRLFFLATAGLFGHQNGNLWGVGHYLMKPVGA